MKILITESQLELLKETIKFNQSDIEKRISIYYNDFLKAYKNVIDRYPKHIKQIEKNKKKYEAWLDILKSIDETEFQKRRQYMIKMNIMGSSNIDIIGPYSFETLNDGIEWLTKNIKSLPNDIKNDVWDWDELKPYLSKKRRGPKTFSEFYYETYDKVKNDFINSGGNNKDDSDKIKTIESSFLKQFEDSLTKEEKKDIANFLVYVIIRQRSGWGETVERSEIKRLFYKTPLKFQKLYSIKPSYMYWRGDDCHPCDKNCHNEIKGLKDKNYFDMQSFSHSKNVAKSFGRIAFNAKNIGSYGGSFSLALFDKNPILLNSEEFKKTYGNYYVENDVYIEPGEDEIMFFDVVYKCNRDVKVPQDKLNKPDYKYWEKDKIVDMNWFMQG